MMSLWDALRMNMMISYQELVRTFLSFLLFYFYDIITLHRAFFVLIFVGDLDGADGLWSL